MKLLLFFSAILLPQILCAQVKTVETGFYLEKGFLTHSQANIQIPTQSMQLQDVPGLALLEKRIREMPVDPHVIDQVFAMVHPARGHRSYYKISEKDLSPRVRERIVEEYSKLFNIPKEEVVLFAITNGLGETFLLPEFFKLPLPQQVAMLFHEGLWVLNPQFSYKDVVTAEAAAEVYFARPFNYAAGEDAYPFFESLSKLLDSKALHPEILLQAAFFYDFVNAPPEHPSIEQIYFRRVLDESFINCYNLNRQDSSALANCTRELQLSLMANTQTQSRVFYQALVAMMTMAPSYFLCFESANSSKEGTLLLPVFSQDWQSDIFLSTAPIRQSEILSPSSGTEMNVHQIFKLHNRRFIEWGALGLCNLAEP